MKKIFITATDTDAGKTHVAQALVNKFVNLGQKVAVFKPVSAGCTWVGDQLVNEDAALLMEQANADQSYHSVNPIAFEEPIAPHIAAETEGVSIVPEHLISHYHQVLELNADVVITEGAGGWRLPLGGGQYLSDLAKETNQTVILVVNMKLGCLNHALLTAEAIRNDGLTIVGWVANAQQPMPYLSENIKELSQLLSCPLMASIEFEPDVTIVAKDLDVSGLTS